MVFVEISIIKSESTASISAKSENDDFARTVVGYVSDILKRN